MKKCKLFLNVCAALFVVLLASCSSQEEENLVPSSEGNSVRIKITRSESPETRAGAAVSTPVGTTKALEIKKGGHLFFVNASGNITKYVRVLGSSEGAGDNETTVQFTDIDNQEGGVIKNVPSASVKVHIFLNLPAAVSNQLIGKSSGPFSVIESNVVTAVDLTGGGIALGVDSVAVSGSGNLTATTGNLGGVDYALEAAFNLTAIASRIEIVQITTAPASNGYFIKSFDLTGIFINNYYPSVTLGGTLGVLQNAGASLTAYDETHGQFFYRTQTAVTTLGTYLFTTGATQNGSFGTYVSYNAPTTYPYVSAGLGNVWGYNIFPNATASADLVPHIIIRLSNVVVSDGTTDYPYDDDQFVTVKGFLSGGSPVTQLQRGVVYQLGGSTSAKFEITFDNLSPQPETKPVNALVTATLVNWTTVNVTPAY
ncbi:MAG: hypothetical protein LBQ78_03940 [Tannerellaceae bacterium]|jgi:hypothetical protein|nr:hypothetical protein [Tannerellaceae bacterium]